MGFLINGQGSFYARTCTECQQTFVLDITQAQLNQWRAGGLIQNVMPHLTSDERELLISGICGKCFDAMFKEAKEEYQ